MQKVCGECNEKMCFKNGKIRRPHFSHIGKKNCTNNGESDAHRLSKELLANFLKDKGQIVVVSECSHCYKNIDKKLPIFNNAIVEYRLENNGVADVAAFTGEKLFFVFEVLWTHKTNPEKRKECNWAEIFADNIFSQYKTESKLWILKDLRKDIVCNEFCLSMLDLAKKLGYYSERKTVPDYATISRCEIDKALRGEYRMIEIGGWSSEPFEKSNYWNIFLIRERCIRCTKPNSEIKYKRPFCLSCYKNIMANEEDENEHWDSIDKDEKFSLRKKYSWLDNIPGNSGPFAPCSICKTDYTGNNEKYEKYWKPNSNYVENYVWWFGDKKQCCTICLENKRIESEK